MLVDLLQAPWMFFAIGAVVFLVYGGWLVWLYEFTSSIANQHTVARLALHDSLPPDELAEVKAAALNLDTHSGSLDAPRSQSVVTMVAGTDRPQSVGHHRVLVVEDDLDSVHSTAVLIKMMGHECQFAINGFAALKIAREFHPDIILLDIGLPDFKGYEIAKQLEWEPGLEGTRIIAVTALPEVDRQRALDAGCHEFYRKPLDPMLLEQLLVKPLAFERRAAA